MSTSEQDLNVKGAVLQPTHETTSIAAVMDTPALDSTATPEDIEKALSQSPTANQAQLLTDFTNKFSQELAAGNMSAEDKLKGLQFIEEQTSLIKGNAETEFSSGMANSTKPGMVKKDIGNKEPEAKKPVSSQRQHEPGRNPVEDFIMIMAYLLSLLFGLKKSVANVVGATQPDANEDNPEALLQAKESLAETNQGLGETVTDLGNKLEMQKSNQSEYELDEAQLNR